MMNDLFNQTLLRKYSKNFKLTPSKHDLILKHIQKLEEGQFEAETKNYIYFYEVWLKGILGYDLDENILIDEKEEKGRGKSEFILKSGDKKFMVVELKDQKTDLDKPQNRFNDKRTPVDQAFDYAQHTGDIDWILVSNYNEFRLYNWHKKGQYISFNAGELLDKTQFSYFMLSFSKKSHIETSYIDKLMDKTVVIERELEKEFYKLYNETRLMLIKEFEELNNLSRVKAIHYAQMIMNRYMFICFAEDIDLLPAQVSTDTILTPILKGNLRHGSIWQRLNELFLDINEGNEYKKISQYNGGIFKENLDHLKIRDIVEDQKFFNDIYQDWKFEEYEKDINTNLGPYGKKVNPIYRNMLTISTFDFSTELDVNILGHIFENSIGDIEELKADSKGRRKKEGIFYTPEYITDYICRNTIIPYLSKSGQANTIPDLIGEYWGSAIEELDQKVKNIKVVDPACGSGAFLNKAADILLEIHQEIHETRYKGKKETLKPYFDNIGQRREILLNNIYGVDLNEESVDITKLSLFLKVCRKGLILPNLEKNIKCGNSLINDPEFSDKPFKWEEEFPNIFKEGKFDIVIGNPPYVRVQNLLYKDIDYYKKAFTCAYKRIDISVLFIELANYLLKENGLNAYITSNQFLKSEYGRKTREYILENYNIQKIIDFGDLPIFGDAITYVSIFIFKKGKTLEFDYYNVIKVDTDLNTINPMIINPEYLGDESWLLENIEFQKIYDKINKFPPLKKNKCKCWTGIKTGRDKVFIFDLKDIKNIKIEEEVMLPLLTSKDCDRYNYPTSSKYVIYPYKLVDSKTVLLSEEEIKNKYPQLYKYLLDNKEEIFLRKDSRKNFSKKSNWYSLTRFGRIDIFNKEKIIFPGISKINKFGLDKEGYVFLGASVYAITSEDPDVSLKYLLTILNSTLIEKYLHSITPLKKGGFYSYLASHIDNLSIPMIDSTLQKPFIIKTNKNIQLSNEFKDEINGFKGWLQRTFNMETFSKKLDKYYKLSLDEFSAELNKKKVDTTQRKTQELLKQEFEKSIAVIKPLLQEIEQTDNEINQMVYDLYGLTSKEIKIIEGSLN